METPQEKTDPGDELRAHCPYCGTLYLDEGGVLAHLQKGFAGAPLLVVAGCGSCRRLFVPLQPPGLAVSPPGTLRLEPDQPTPPPRYFLYHCIGRGGMGETYRAVDRKTQGEVCIKKLFDPRFASALRQEWRALARLHHPGIVQLLDFVEQGPEVQLVMEYVSGQSLASLIRRCLLPEVLVTELGVRLAEALVYAGEQQVIHCDLKPDNILVGGARASLWPKILDFGLAIVEQRDERGEVTARGRRAGTVRYMAPEQFSGRQLTPACDIYALGLILDEMLRGQPAFSGDTWAVFAHKQQAVEGIEPPAGCSTGLAELIRGCTRAEPTLRLTAAEVLGRLRSLLIQVPPPAVRAPINLDFQQPEVDGQLPGWFDSQGFVAGVSPDFQVSRLLRQDGRAGRHLQLSRTAPKGFSSLMQRCWAQHLAGQRLRFTGQLRGEELSGWGGLWLRADGPRGSLLFDNMSERPLRGTTEWTPYRFEALLPEGTRWLCYGLVLEGAGRLQVDELHLEILLPDGSWKQLGVDPEGPDEAELALT